MTVANSRQFVQQSFCLFQIRRVEAFGEPAVDWGEQTPSFPSSLGSRANFRSAARFVSMVDRTSEGQNSLRNCKILESCLLNLVASNALTTAP